jgi:hypothetical protein
MVDRRSIYAENAYGGQPRRQPHPQPGLCPLQGQPLEVKVPPPPDGLMSPGLLSTLHFFALLLRSLMVAIMAEKQKIIFRLDSGALFSVLPFSPGP